VLTTVAVLALSGCGGDDNGSSDEATETVDSGLALEQDAEAKAAARNLVALVEVCYVDNQDYTQCIDAAGGEDVGEATVEAPSASEYTVTSPSESGNEFRVTKTGGAALERTCDEAGMGGCADDGSW
jgi:hypothetical protein